MGLLTADRLREVIQYDQSTGAFTWKTKTNRRIVAGANAGHKHCAGYVATSIDGRRYLMHRLAWLYVHGEWPKGQIDHINGERTDNRLSNLRDVKPSTNLENQRKAKTNNKSGFLGVMPKGLRWAAQIKAFGIRRHIGTFDTPEQAHAAYINAKRHFHEGNTL